jgi:nitrogen fixation protein NifX
VLKVAFATKDGTAVDQHFGWCRRFDVYGITDVHAELLETRTLPPASGAKDGAGEGDKIDSRLAAVADCAIVHLTSIGGTAAARVVNARVHPVKVPEGAPIPELLERLQAVLAGNPPPWLRKILRQHDPALAPAWSPA